MTTASDQGIARIDLRLPTRIRASVSAVAEAEHRSVNSQLVVLIERGLGEETLIPPVAAPLVRRPKARAELDRPGDRDDVERVCQHLADRIEQQTAVRPAIGVQWRRAARLMIDKDDRTEQAIHTAIDWCQDDEFWRANILSMSKLRAKWLQLRAAAGQRNRPGQPSRSTTDDRVAAAQALKRRPGPDRLEITR